MWDWLEQLLATDAFPARWNCGDWPPWLGWLHVVADFVTGVAYLAIPVVIASFLLRRRDLPFPRLFALFALFILCCGSVHLVEAAIFWWPVYPFQGLLKGVTALVSLVTAVALVPTMRRALRLPGFEESTARLAAIVGASSDAITAKDLDGIITSWNEGARRLYGYAADEIVGKSFLELVPDDRRQEAVEVTAKLRRGEVVEAFETERVTRDGRRIPVSLSLSLVRDRRGRAFSIAAIARDISVQKLYEAEMEANAVRLQRANRRLRELADRDPLTGLLNRRGLEVVLRSEEERIKRYGSRAAVVLVDLDDFKSFNSDHGHHVGDEVLREVGDRIDDALRDSDRVARIGGDEFLVLAVEAGEDEALQLAERVRRAVGDRPFQTSAGELEVRVSCGVEPIAAGKIAFEQLLGNASAAIRLAKERGKNAIGSRGGVDAPAAGVPTVDEVRALRQPIVDLRSGDVVAIEFLIRGPSGPLETPAGLFERHRGRGTLSETDLVCLQRCMRGVARLEPEHCAHVNLFPSTLVEVEPDRVAAILQSAGHARSVCVELNEAMIGRDLGALPERVRALRERTGCRIAIDDVGFGYSSLEALLMLEPDVIKIDRNFVHGIAADREHRRGLERLLSVARALDAEVIVEGVERVADRDVLCELGVAMAQGYLFGRPSAN